MWDAHEADSGGSPGRSGLRARRARIGIITGSGPEAGLDLWGKVLRANRSLLGSRYAGDLSAPEVTIRSVPTLGLSMDLERNHDTVWAVLRETAVELAPFADVYGIACNTLNCFEPDLTEIGLPARLITVAEVCRRYVTTHAVERPALLGSRQTMSLGPWSAYRGLAEFGMEFETPEDHDELHSIIHWVKTHGPAHGEARRRFRNLIARLESPAVFLACTELPLIVQPMEGKRLIDVSDLLAQALAYLALYGGAPIWPGFGSIPFRTVAQ
jgi:aspartate racemase